MKKRLLVLLFLAPTACAVASAGPDTDESSDKVTDVSHTPVKDQSIGNCWVYATASWAESLHRGYAKEDVNLSESYWTYWSWFDRILAAEVPDGGPLKTGGSWTWAAHLASRYGYMFEGDFIPEEATMDRSARQASAETAIQASIKTGALATAEARANPELVRRELDKAWQLGPDVVKQLDAAFGASVTKRFDPTSTVRDGAPAVHPPKDLTAGKDGDKELTLADVVGTGNAFHRAGTYAWNTFDYPDAALDRRHIQERVQRALHDSKPVVITWFVDFAAMKSQGQFLAPPPSPGQQGGHLTVLEDYQITNVPGFGTLKAGVLETRPEALQAALSDSATIEFFRIKNSWGDYRSVPDMTGYHDLYMKYLDGPMKECDEDTKANCSDKTPLEAFTLPPGY